MTKKLVGYDLVAIKTHPKSRPVAFLHVLTLHFAKFSHRHETKMEIREHASHPWTNVSQSRTCKGANLVIMILHATNRFL
jgi:hypothetical protein